MFLKILQNVEQFNWLYRYILKEIGGQRDWINTSRWCKMSHAKKTREVRKIKCLLLLRARRKWHDWQSTQNEWVERCQWQAPQTQVYYWTILVHLSVQSTTVQYTRTVVRVSCTSYVRCLYWYTNRCTLYFCGRTRLRVHVLALK